MTSRGSPQGKRTCAERPGWCLNILVALDRRTLAIRPGVRSFSGPSRIWNTCISAQIRSVSACMLCVDARRSYLMSHEVSKPFAPGIPYSSRYGRLLPVWIQNHGRHK